jgi:hypothetical protein
MLGSVVRVDAIADGDEVWVQTSRQEVERQAIEAGGSIGLRPTRTLPAGQAAGGAATHLVRTG